MTAGSGSESVLGQSLPVSGQVADTSHGGRRERPAAQLREVRIGSGSGSE